MNKLQLEYSRYLAFRSEWANREFLSLRYGQAFYDYFQLHKMTNQEQFDKLYNANNQDSLKIIEELFDFT